MNKLSRIFTALVALVFVTSAGLLEATTYAITPEQKRVYQLGVYAFDIALDSDSCGSGDDSTFHGTGDISTDQSQEEIALTIIGIAKTYKLGDLGATIGVMVALAESGLKIYANSGIPLSLNHPNNQAVGSDSDSLGVFQQRPSQGWSTFGTDPNNQKVVDQLMDPAYNAQAFFGSPPGSDAPSALSKGLQNKSNWETKEPWRVAQEVQGSFDDSGSNYREEYAAAKALVAKLYPDAPVVPLPQSITGGNDEEVTEDPPSVESCDGSGGSAIKCTSNDVASGAAVSTIRKNAVCIAKAELEKWGSGKLTPGTGYLEYSEGVKENWCADFTSWVYNKAGYPIGEGSKWRVSAVNQQMIIGQREQSWHWHKAGSYTPKPGDLLVEIGVHVNMVVAVEGETITLIGGNQSGEGNSNGYFNTSSVTQYNVQLSKISNPAKYGYVTPD